MIDAYPLINIVITIICIAVSWWGLQAFRFDLFLKKADSPQAKLLQVLLSIFLGSGVARFFMEYLSSSLLLGRLFS
ncbi:DUF1146 domain-containing protein [Brevibacillus sp. SYP-B805]|uniref:DUF1146 family protein n=1 Tax=Brevibacillus sp. SYP-B805 TaxID=1578199 RepID=UPI0013ECCBFC|nr:DUF1146 family protein [Brevibacillus sp. SYP-B805]NGQ95576.1 DUF1146 domain-containing protein [Brevibacillus sp. SYP-B805]